MRKQRKGIADGEIFDRSVTVDWEDSRYIDDRCTIFNKESGVLLDIPSLPGSYGIGELGPHALKFIQLLQETGQQLWHIHSLRIPEDPETFFTGTSYGWNTALIAFAWLREDGLVTREQLEEFKKSIIGLEGNRSAILRLRFNFLEQVAKTFQAKASQELRAAYMRYRKFNRLWLDQFALFQVLKEELRDPWYTWPEALRAADEVAIEHAQQQLRERIFEKGVLQFLFARYWERIWSAAHYAGIRIILSVPVYVAHDSYEVWKNQSLFFTDEEGNMTVTGGLLPCKLLPEGKLFKGPQYRWNRVKAEGYKFWVNRFRREFQNVDIVALEHFHSLFEADEFSGDIAAHRFVPTGDRGLFDAVYATLKVKNFIASDRFAVNDKMQRAIRQLELAGAVDVALSFSSDKLATQVFPKDYTCRHIAYTSNTGTATLLGWLKNFAEPLSAESRQELQRCFGTDLNRVNHNGRLHLSESQAGAVMTTLPDLLELEEVKFSQWRFTWDQITDVVKTRLLQFSQR